MRHCDECGYLGYDGYEYPESYCIVGVQEDDPKFDEDGQACGCHYNLRTLRKMKKENDRAEYLCYLGYDDYMLMPTIYYTEDNKKILERHREIVRHALGMDNKKGYIRHGKRFYQPYRNYFYTTEHTTDYPYCERLVNAGLAEKGKYKEGFTYIITRRGMDWLAQHDGITIYNEKR